MENKLNLHCTNIIRLTFFEHEYTTSEAVRKYLKNKCGYIEYDLNSPDQLKEFLFTLGWVPDLWNINKETKERTSPKITESSLDSIGSSDLGRWISRYYTLKHRRNTLENINDPENKGLLSYLDEKNTVAADAFTVGTPTLRYRHKPPVKLAGEKPL